MFKIVVLVVALAGQVISFGVSSKDYATKAACEQDIPRAVELTKQAEPGQTYQAACLDKALVEKTIRDGQPKEKLDGI